MKKNQKTICYQMNSKNLVVLFLIKNEQQIEFSLNMILDIMLVIVYAVNLF